MPLLVNSHDPRPHEALEYFFRTFLYPRLDNATIAAIRQHLAEIRQQPQSNVSVQLETIPQLRLTRVTVEITHPESSINQQSS